MHCSETVWKPKIWPVPLSQITIKMRKINRMYQNLISTEGGLDTSACQISGHSSNAFYRKCPAKSTCFTKSRKINRLDQNLIISEVTRMHQHAKFQAILIMTSQENARKPKIWPVSQVKVQPKWGKSTDLDQNLISSESGQDTPECKISGHSSRQSAEHIRTTKIWPVSLSQNAIKMRKTNKLRPKSNQFWTWSRYMSIPKTTSTKSAKMVKIAYLLPPKDQYKHSHSAAHHRKAMVHHVRCCWANATGRRVHCPPSAVS